MNETNLILDADSYKMCHQFAYPKGANAMFSYIEARKPNETIVPFGLQMWIKKTLLSPITVENIDQAEDIVTKHGLPFKREKWQYIIDKYDGYLPFKIRGIPEGTPVPSLTPIVTVECMDPEVFWLASFIETSLQRAIWYPTTIVSLDRESYLHLAKLYEFGSDQQFMLDFSLHSFASRGVTSKETAEIGGLAHLVYFKGTDDLVALVSGRKYYHEDMAGYSVRATEHSVETSFGNLGAREYFDHMLSEFGKPGVIVSVVMDGYDIYREVDLLCTEYKDKIIESEIAKWVIRPDSGDPVEVLPKILARISDGFGYTVNSKGKKVINNVGIIQGDGINRETLIQLSNLIDSLGYAPECVIWGSGGGLLNNVNRDTYGFAQKTSAIRIGDEWIDTVKSPVTDSGKKSKGGRLDNPLFVDFYENGKLLVDDSLETIRNRAKIE